MIQSIQSAWRKLKELCLRFFSKHPPTEKPKPENSEDQNPQNSPPEESAKTKDKSSKGVKEPDSNSPSPAQTHPSEKTETATPPKQPQENQTQVLAEETPEPSPQESSDSSESSDAAKDEISKTQQDPPKEETPPPLDSLPPPEKSQPQSESEQNRTPQKQQSKPPKAPGKRGKTNQIAENDNRAPKPRPPQCRFVCYEENNGRWAVALAIEGGQDVQSVRQGKEITANDGRYILEDISAEVTVEFKGEHSSKALNLFDEHNDEHKFVVFKMRKDWQGEGQKVKTLSSGEYIVFAHKSCGKRIGKPPIEAGQCRYSDFSAHFFFLSEDSEMNDGFENCSLPSSTKRFSLKGRSFADDSDLGELFGGDAPQLIDAEEWRGISWIVVGREKGGKALAKFRPEEKTIHPKEIPLAEVLGERSGWFFVRIYDAKVKLLDSFDFRRAKGLKNIFINNQSLGEVDPIEPSMNGHTKTIVQFGGNLSVHPADDSNRICKVRENTFAVLPHPDNDGTKWVLGSGEDCVEAEILLPRIWWKFIEEKGKEGDWRDTPIEMEREKFRRAENEKIRIRLPLCIPEIVVGFDDLNSTDNPTFRTKLSTDRKTCEVELRLDSFADYQDIKKPLRKAMDLRVKLKVKDSDVVFPIVRIPADAKPKPLKIKPDIGEGFSPGSWKEQKRNYTKKG